MDLLDLASLPDPFPVEPVGHPLDATVTVPGSKSITNRALVCAALARGRSTLSGALFADDTEAMVGVLEALGLGVEADPSAETIAVDGTSGVLPASDRPIDVRQSGTTARFVLPMLTLGTGAYRVGAHPQMQARPMDATFDALRRLGGRIEEVATSGHLPATVTAGPMRSEVVHVPGDASSQFLSGLLMIGPCLPDGLVVELSTDLVSRPYVEMTLAVMRAFGAVAEQVGERTFAVQPGGYVGCEYRVEPDASAASYPFAAAAICGGRVRVSGLGVDAIQGDVGFLDVLSEMGARVTRQGEWSEVEVERGSLVGGRFDLTDISDTAQSLAVVAPFASTTVEVTGIGFIRRKETDRVTAVATELARCGVDVTVHDDGWTIRPGAPGPAVIHTYEDHRMAMSFALLGLAVPGVEIADPGCVAKTFPGYWDVLGRVAGRV